MYWFKLGFEIVLYGRQTKLDLTKMNTSVFTAKLSSLNQVR